MYNGTAVLRAAFCISSVESAPSPDINSSLTFPLQVLLDCIVLDFDVFHDSLEALDGIIQSGNDTRGRKLTQTEKQHEGERLDIVMVFERFEDSLDECGQVDLGKACAELGISVG